MRVPAGTTVFDGACWNGIAIDSTCGGHGTCKKCRVKITDGNVPVGRLDGRAFTPDELRDGWRLACRAQANEDLMIEVPPLQTRPKAALVGVGRHVILRPAVNKRYLELDEPTLEDQVLRPRARARRDRRLRAPGRARRRARRSARTLRDAELEGHGGDRRRPADRRRAGRHDRAPARDRVRPRHHHGRGHAARPVDTRPAARRALDAEPAAAVRRRRDLADLRDDDGRHRARHAAAARARDARPARAGGLRGGRASRRTRSTRSRWPATRR